MSTRTPTTGAAVHVVAGFIGTDATDPQARKVAAALLAIASATVTR